jgi:hypothetical protein
MVTVPAIDAHVSAIIARLESVGLYVGDHIAPEPLRYPYVVVYMIAGGQADGPVVDVNADAELIWQTMSVGQGPVETRQTGDLVRSTLVGHALTVTGRSVEPCQLLAGSPVVQRDPRFSPVLFDMSDRYRAWSYPA